MSKPSGEDPARSRAEQPDPERAYHEALAALDEALRQLATTTHAGSFQASEPDPPHGWRQRLSVFAWRRVPLLRQQRAFNALLVDTLTRFVRQITPYIDARDRELSASVSRLAEDAASAREKLAADAAGARDRLAADFSGALGGTADELLKRWESLAAGEQRRQAQLDEVRQAATAWRQVTGALRQELDRLRAQPSPAASPAHEVAGAGQPDAGTQLATPQDSYKYVGFEDRFRGAPVDIRAGFADYARHFEGASDVLDAGCGRGEFLEILRGTGVTASGVDVNPEMVAQCRERGLDVTEGDLLAHLAVLPDASLGGLFAAQVVEHLEPAYLLKFIDTAFLKLRPGARIVLETINVASWTAFFQSYVRDITHVRPLHPDTLAYLVTAGGFQQVEVVYRSPIPPEHRLARAPEPADAGETPDRMAAVFNRNVDELNRLLFADQDYAVVAQRG
ncbi:MAG: class I SAM-dependent methyltransferase [Acidobacteria bacterium]|nr:class I SAM-dependent methyltransferase [Acidobacteriota bacterium]